MPPLEVILEVLSTIGVFIFILSFLVIIHEIGHYLAARWAGITVEEFGLGYPPRLKTLFHHRGVPFTLNWIPFGGFVRLLGEDGENESRANEDGEGGTNEDEVSKKVSKDGAEDARKKQGAFYLKPLIPRMVVILAGAFMNLVFGVIAFTLLCSLIGVPELQPISRIGKVVPDSPAAKAGLPVGVNIIAVAPQGGASVSTPTSQDVRREVKKYQGQTIQVLVSGPCEAETTQCHPGEYEYTVHVRNEKELPAGQGLLGITFDPLITYHFFPWYEMPFHATVYGLEQATGVILMVLNTLGSMGQELSRGALPAGIAGPVGIVHQATQVGIVRQGLPALLHFSGMISINLAIMNVLPFPALDGGRAVFLLLEKIIGKKRVSLFENHANTFGFLFLLAVIVAVTIQDVRRIFVPS